MGGQMQRSSSFLALCSFVGLCAFSSDARPCGAFVSRDVKTVPSLAVEQSLIVFDEAKQLEHFVRQVAIRDPSPGFGFVVPTPERPEVAKVAVSPFEKLAKSFPVSSGLRAAGTRGGGMGGGAPRAAVQVLSRERVGSFTAFVLAASDAAALEKWLSDNQFAVSPETQAWLGHYVKLGFYFAALRYEQPERKGDQIAIRAEVVRITFKTPLPFYPYREPAHAPSAAPRDLAVWLVATRRYVPVSLWQAPAGSSWKRPWLEHSQREFARAGLVEMLQEPLAGLLPKRSADTLSVQVFEDQKRDRRGFGDVVLVPATATPLGTSNLPATTKLMKSLDPAYEGP
jgi:hypothetical protein